jgi:2-oxoglutarate/2-oxoacid ferredoxin oxidoreductase subunit alpha
MPTWTGQGDLRFVMHSHQDDFPRIVIAPGDAEEAYYATAEAHNIAEIYQTPVIVLTDKHLAESHMTASLDKPVKIDRGALLGKAPANYKRYKFTKTGISPRALVGTAGALIRANSYEHDESGFTTEDSGMRSRMMEKRMGKLDSFKVPAPKLYGPKNAKLTFVAFGSSKGAILDGMKLLESQGIKANLLHFVYISPFPQSAKAILAKAKKLVAVEGNYTAQFAGVIAQNTGIIIEKKLLKYDGRPFYPEEIAEYGKKVLKK